MSSIEINPAYTKSPAQVGAQIKSAFFDNEAIPNIKLGQILDASSYEKLSQTVSRTTLKPHVSPLEYRYGIASLKLPQLTKSLSKFLKPIFGIELKEESWKLVSLTWKEYSMILDSYKSRVGFDVIVDVSDDFPDNAGADIVYTTGGEETVEIPASSNTLIIVKIGDKTRSFLRYANHYAKDKKRNFLVQHI